MRLLYSTLQLDYRPYQLGNAMDSARPSVRLFLLYLLNQLTVVLDLLHVIGSVRL